MKLLRLFLLVSTILIYVLTLLAVMAKGFNWPVVYFGDLFQLNWRSQFNADFLIHLFLLANWVAWREGFTGKGYLFGFLSIFMGGMFGLHTCWLPHIKPREIRDYYYSVFMPVRRN